MKDTKRYNDKAKPRVAVIGLRGFPNVQGGVEKHCEALYPRMRDFYFTVYRRTPYIDASSPKNWHGIDFVDLPSTRLKGVEAFFHTFISSLSVIRRRPAIVHIHNIGPGLFAPLLKMAGLKVVTTYHSANYEHKKWGAFARAILRFGERMSLKYSDHIIFVNKSKYEAQKPEVRAKSSLIPNGVVIPEPSENIDYLESLGIKPGEYMLGVGRLTPEKGFEYLVEGAQNADAIKQLVIAGGSDHDTTYFERLKGLDVKHKTIFTGNVQGEQLRQLYSHARGFVLSSVTEGFPLVLLEAMSYRLPVLVSRIDATAGLDIIPADNYFDAADAVSLGEALKKFASDNPQLSRADYNLQPYSWDAIADETSQIYKGIL